MSAHGKDCDRVNTLWGIYESQMPGFLRPFLLSPALRRLQGIGMNCGCEYTSFPLFRRVLPYSRWDHSVGTALITWHMTGEEVPSLTALFHDVSAPVFAHVIDFVKGDYLLQEATEEGTARRIREDPVLAGLLREQGIPVDLVSEDRLYPFVNNETPRLCADRLEYTLGNLLHFGICTADEIRALYNALTVTRAEDEADELAFADWETAARFARLALRCSRIYVSEEDRYAMQRLAELIRRTMEKGLLREEDLWTTEAAVLNRIRADQELREEWEAFTALSRTERAERPDGRPGWRQIPAKKRWIDPLVAGEGRLSSLDLDFAREAEAFVQSPLTAWIRGD